MKLTGVDEEGPSRFQNQILELLNSSLKKRERTPLPVLSFENWEVLI